MIFADKPYIHIAIDAVDIVLHDVEGRHDNERSDRFSTYEEARDAALSCVELMLDEGDYDGDDHRQELERMLRLLETASCFEELDRAPEYRWFLSRLEPAHRGAA